MKWLWNWGKPKLSSVDNSSIEELRNQLTTLQSNVNNIQNTINLIPNNYIAKSQTSYVLNSGSDNYVINVPTGKANYIELKRNNVRKTTMGVGSSTSDIFSIESTGNIKLKPTGYIDASGYQIQNVGNPTTSSSAVTKQYVDNATNTNATNITNLTTRVSALENQSPSSSNNELFYIKGYVEFTNTNMTIQLGTKINIQASTFNVNGKKYQIHSIWNGSVINVVNWSLQDPTGMTGQWGQTLLSGWVKINSAPIIMSSTTIQMSDVIAVGGDFMWIPTPGMNQTINITTNGEGKLQLHYTMIVSKNTLVEYNPPQVSSYGSNENTNEFIVTTFEPIGEYSEYIR